MQWSKQGTAVPWRRPLSVHDAGTLGAPGARWNRSPWPGHANTHRHADTLPATARAWAPRRVATGASGSLCVSPGGLRASCTCATGHWQDLRVFTTLLWYFTEWPPCPTTYTSSR